jgi:hypothetical protein
MKIKTERLIKTPMGALKPQLIVFKNLLLISMTRELRQTFLKLVKRPKRPKELIGMSLT